MRGEGAGFEDGHSRVYLAGLSAGLRRKLALQTALCMSAK